jgi:hypothetical protein
VKFFTISVGLMIAISQDASALTKGCLGEAHSWLSKALKYDPNFGDLLIAKSA